MERIKVALEKARQERQNVASNATPALQESEISSSSASDLPASTQDISYSQTRSAKVSPMLMKRNRIVTAYQHGEYDDAFKILRTQVLQRLNED